MDEIKPTEKLDGVLNNLLAVKSTNWTNGFDVSKYLKKPKEFTLTQTELDSILNKLHKDQFIDKKLKNTKISAGEIPHYKINFDGELLLQKGGYTQQLKEKETQQKKKEQDIKTAQRNDGIITKAAPWTAIGAILLFLIELTRFLFDTFYFLCK